MDDTIFSQKGIDNLLNPSKQKKIPESDDQNKESEDPIDNTHFNNYFHNWLKNNLSGNNFQSNQDVVSNSNTNSDLKKNENILNTDKLKSTEEIYATKTNPESFPQIMDNKEIFGRIPSQQIVTFVIQMLNSLLGQSEFQDQLIQELLRRKDFCEKLRNILLKDTLNQSLKL